jgi:hypothetical protein
MEHWWNGTDRGIHQSHVEIPGIDPGVRPPALTAPIIENTIDLNCTGLFICPSGISELGCAIFRHDYTLAVEPASTPRPPVKKPWRDSLPIDMLLSAVSVLVVAQSSSEISEGLMNNPVYEDSVRTV